MPLMVAAVCNGRGKVRGLLKDYARATAMHLPFAFFLNLLAISAVAGDFAPMALNSYTAAPTVLRSATVFQQDGTVLGNIQGVERSASGINLVRIGVAGGRVITLQAADASYDAAKNQVVTDMAATKAAAAKGSAP